MTTNTTPAPATRPTIHLDGEAVPIARPAPAPCTATVRAADENRVVRALATAATTGRLPASPPSSYGRALARALMMDPAEVAQRLKAGIHLSYSDSADIATVVASLGALTALPGTQPRGASQGGRSGQVPDPAEGVDVEAAAMGLAVLLFDDPGHLRDWCTDALARSLPRALSLGRREEIGSTGVRRTVTASMTLLQFRDGTAAQWVPMVSDGISRLAVCATTLLELEGHAETDAARVVMEHAIPARLLTPSSSNHELARQMRRNQDAVTKDYTRHVIDGVEDEHAARLRQFMTLPAAMHLMAVDPGTSSAGSMELAMEGIVSDLHTGVDGWVSEDSAHNAAKLALKRMAREGTLDPELLALCLSRTDLQTSPLLRPANWTSEGHPDDATVDCGTDRLLLRRAVVVLASLLNRTTYGPLKSALKHCTPRSRFKREHVVDLIAPLVCEPWGARRPMTRAWGYGGPVPSWILDIDFTPTHPEDYLSLVAIAMGEGNSEDAVKCARLELALAGGTALIAEGLLTTALVGGSGGSGGDSLPFRGSIDTAVEALTLTLEGLTALAVAANHFRPSSSTRNVSTPAIDFDRPDKVARDGMGVAVPTTERVLASFAVLAAPEELGPQAPERREPTPLETLRTLAGRLPSQARSLLHDAELVRSLCDTTGGPTGISRVDLEAAYEALHRATGIVGRLP